MKRLILPALTLLLLCASPRAGNAQNLLANPGFEEAVTNDGPPFVGFWEVFTGGAGAGATNSTAMPRSGTRHLDLTIANIDNTFTGAFQDVPITAGTEYRLSGWHLSMSNPFDATAEIRIEWRNATVEVGRTPNLSPIPTTAYAPFSLSALAPAGADTARVVYAMQTFTGGPTNNGKLFVDDMSFVVVPEPSSALLLLLGSLAAGRARSRKTAQGLPGGAAGA